MFSEKKRLKQLNAWCLDKGLQRENNQDYLSIIEVLPALDKEEPFIGIYALADGMGGLAHGERASYLAVHAATQVMVYNLQSDTSADYERCLEKATDTAHRILQAENAMRPKHQSGTTLVIALVADNQVYLSNVGDSRAYIIAENEIRQISRDHNIVAALVEAGALNRKEALQSPLRNTLTQAIGLDMPLEPHLNCATVDEGDYLLLCSDGLYSLIDEEKILSIILDAPSVAIACQRLKNAANAAGGDDNIAVILVQIHNAS